jgi:aldose 1-epimerase
MHPWVVVRSDATSALLAFDYAPAGGDAHEWPYAYCAEQQFVLDGQCLTITLSVENRDTRPWPAGLGLHPYVAHTPRTTLRFEADTIWTTDADSLPGERQAVEGDTEFDRGRDVSADVIDNCFAGWGGEATVHWPEHDLTLTLTATLPLDHLQLYTPAGRDFLGLEPVSNMPDAINRMDAVSDQGLRVLAPGARLEGMVRFSIAQR